MPTGAETKPTMSQPQSQPHIVTLIPLSPELHAAAVQAVYDATPGYWEMYDLLGAPPDQAATDLNAAAEEEGRFLLGIVRRVDPTNAAAGGELIGVVDFRLHWPAEAVAYVGMVMVAQPYQRQGIATQTWSLLKPWLASTAQMRTARVGVEQFNIPGLKFWESAGFTLTGDSNRLRVGDKFVRILYMDEPLTIEN